MPFNPDLHHRRSIRLHNFDYATPGAYFVTIVTQDRECLLGGVVGGEMRLNECGRMVQKWLKKLSNKYPTVILGEYIIMPNHLHVVVWIVGADPCVCPDRQPDHHDRQPDRPNHQPDRAGQRPGTIAGRTHGCAPTLNRIIQWFKTMTTNESIRTAGIFRPGKLWQRNYWERIVRGDAELNRIRQYIVDNPSQWSIDPERPACGYHP